MRVVNSASGYGLLQGEARHDKKLLPMKPEGQARLYSCRSGRVRGGTGVADKGVEVGPRGSTATGHGPF